MATKKELEAIAKKAKKDKLAKEKKIELDRLEKGQRSLSAIAPAKKVEPEPEVKVVKTKTEEIADLREQLEKDKAIERKRKNKADWDVKIGEDINYFDPDLSYELTGYRPITMTKGLDFDPKLFMETGLTYEETGHYCAYRRGKLAFDFWSEQMRRCREGMTIGKYTITGDHYFFLNYYRILNIGNLTKAAQGRDETFPDFYAKQYEYFHYIELCEALGYDVVALKSRGVKSCPPLRKLRGN
jgi:hypothetical protein